MSLGSTKKRKAGGTFSAKKDDNIDVNFAKMETHYSTYCDDHDVIDGEHLLGYLVGKINKMELPRDEIDALLAQLNEKAHERTETDGCGWECAVKP